MKVLDVAVERFPQFSLAQAGRGVLLARQGKREAARRDAEGALAADPPAVVCYQAGCVYLLTADGDADRRRGIELLRRALRADPKWGEEMPADPDLLPILLKLIKPGSSWQVTAIGRENIWPLQRRVAELGGMLRTGVEDTFYLPTGEKTNGNGQLIDALVRVAREAGREIASPSEARALIGIAN